MEYCLASIVQLLRAAIKDSDSPLYGIRSVYEGDPVKVPETLLPALVVHPVESIPDENNKGTRLSRMNHQLKITLVYNLKEYLGANAKDANRVESVVQSIRRMEATGIDHKPAAKSVRGVILNNPFLPLTLSGGTSFNTAHTTALGRTSYDFTRDRGFPAYEVSQFVNAVVVGDHS